MRKISRFFLLIIGFVSIFLIAISSTFSPVLITNSQVKSCSVSLNAIPKISEFFKKLFRGETKETLKPETTYVYLGGFPLGFTISCSGALVVTSSNESASEILPGDILTKIENISVHSAEEILKLINKEEFAGKTIEVELIRGSEVFKTKITPKFDETQKIYKLGLWIRDNAAGVGTVTFIREDNLRFGALGHPVCDIDSGTCLPVLSGNIYKCNIVGVKKGKGGDPGELKGLFLRSGQKLGSLDSNNNFGVYGNFNKDAISKMNLKKVEVAKKDEVQSGKAKIVCAIEGNQPEEYDIEIVKAYFQTSKSNKSMFIRVTDKRLIEKTGGIVQGMSGSPIIQNNKLVGAVTHVFVSDSTKGYGIYADWMIDN
ncbi:MAG: SpoIVB peptidase [Clostridia bacterium]|nr:SpoIVB peptidase [Clostridia bacterium]